MRSTLLQELGRHAYLFNGKRVLVELPEGFKHLEDDLASILEDMGADVAFRLEPSYGACETLACEASLLGFQVVVHVGHYPYPLYPITECNGVKVVYVPLRYPPNDSMVNKLASSVASVAKGLRVAVAYTPQFELIARRLYSMLKGARDVDVVDARPILGCFFYGLERLDVNAYLVLGSRFHGLGLGLAVHAEKRIILAKETGEVDDITGFVEQVLRVRYGRVLDARDARRWGIIAGVRLGQFRPGIVERVKRILASRGFEYRVYFSARTLIRDLDSIRDVDAFVVTSCPRIAIEDASSYSRPVLTPGELYYLLGVEPRIRFPW